jgi:hypothetical protein
MNNIFIIIFLKILFTDWGLSGNGVVVAVVVGGGGGGGGFVVATAVA